MKISHRIVCILTVMAFISCKNQDGDPGSSATSEVQSPPQNSSPPDADLPKPATSDAGVQQMPPPPLPPHPTNLPHPPLPKKLPPHPPIPAPPHP